MPLLQLPIELFEVVMRIYVQDDSLKNTARARLVCREYHSSLIHFTHPDTRKALSTIASRKRCFTRLRRPISTPCKAQENTSSISNSTLPESSASNCYIKMPGNANSSGFSKISSMIQSNKSGPWIQKPTGYFVLSTRNTSALRLQVSSTSTCAVSSSVASCPIRSHAKICKQSLLRLSATSRYSSTILPKRMTCLSGQGNIFQAHCVLPLRLIRRTW
ncbi:hypothetical protein M3J09_000614 [Ascochyta lentis]